MLSTVTAAVRTVRQPIERLRQPAYTGENRCYPCTVVNLVLTGVTTAALWLVHPAVSGVVLVAGLAAVYLRGYVVPGTPTLTTRYLPAPVLRLFGKADGVECHAGAPIAVTAPELQAADIVTSGPTGARLAPAVSDAIHTRLAAFDELHTAEEIDPEAMPTAALAETLGLSSEAISPVPGAIAFSLPERLVRWVSPAALAVDLAEAAVLADRVDTWTSLGPERRLELLVAVRALVEQCPVCEGPVVRELAVPKTCCRDPDPVVQCRCEACDCALLERPTDAVDGVAPADGWEE